MKNIVILISGAGSNMAAIAEAAQRQDWASQFGARIGAVISNRPDAPGLQWAWQHGIATAVVDHRTFDSREAFDAALADAVDAHQPTLVVLAGFMRVLTAPFVARFAGRMLNIHPSLLPAFPGLHTHQRAIEAGCRFAGASVHWVTEALDGGPIVDQVVVPIFDDDTAPSLAARVQTQEHVLYPRAISRVLPALTVPAWAEAKDEAA
ncbi:phosphoribosylglycinamide formyltransferase [Corticibacter populi]|uniref:Phosphoribosylglycinamide formyltransferase n=1 Tax=Corticibacter populi TaxID=1550736 RepID=A0A3M6QYN4_9BURK|nr:phosphoribosylglycinamide formyltransferase [Corticibacter populi]RMX08125.1 phosphoribosylglycinamide formyltransferase [Corticibacter populi]RZS35377.1 phosphoribosylglycinamide formyltransferase-1 [Corticibacter populi]